MAGLLIRLYVVHQYIDLNWDEP